MPVAATLWLAAADGVSLHGGGKEAAAESPTVGNACKLQSLSITPTWISSWAGGDVVLQVSFPSPSSPWRYFCRQANTRFALISCRRATIDTDDPGKTSPPQTCCRAQHGLSILTCQIIAEFLERARLGTEKPGKYGRIIDFRL